MPSNRPPEKTNTLAIVSFVSSFFVSVAGIVTGHLALRQIKKTNEAGRGLAIAGMVIGYVSAAVTVAAVGVVIFTFISLGAVANSNASTARSTPSMDAYDRLDQPTPTVEAAPSPTSVVPAASIAENRDWTGTINLNGQNMGVTLFGSKSPQGVAVFVTLANQGFYNDTSCHRLTTGGFDVLQCGDPTGTGSGGPGYEFGPIENAPSNNLYKRGDIALARQAYNANSMGSQFFIIYQDTEIPADSAGGYTVVGHITSGLAVVDTIAARSVANGSGDGAPASPALISSITAK